MFGKKIANIAVGLFFIGLPILFEHYAWAGIFLAIVLFSVLFVFRLFNTKNYSIAFDRTDLLAGLYLAYGLVNLLVRPAEVNPILIFQWISVTLVYGYVKTETPSGQKIWIYALVISGVIQTVYGVLQSLYYLETNHPLFDATGSFGNPGPYGGYLAVCGILGLRVLCTEWKTLKAKRFFLLPALAIIGYGLWMADSRAGWIAFGIPAVWVILQGSAFVRRYRKYVYPTIVFVFATGLFFLYEYRPASADGRLNIWKVSSTIIAEKPLFGHGPGSFPTRYMPAQADFLERHPEYAETLSSGNNSYAFNEFIHAACEQGIIGLLFFLALLITVFRNRQPQNSTVGIARYGLTALLLFSCFSYPASQYPLLLFFPLFLGMAADREAVFSFSLQHPNRIRIIIVLTCILLYTTSLYSWKTYARFDRLLNTCLRTDDPDAQLELSRLYPAVGRVPDLVIPYGRVLFRYEQYTEAIPVLERSTGYFASISTLIDLGDAYVETNRTTEAEHCFRQAARMAPSLITPPYKLFLLYQSTNQIEKAIAAAEKIARMKVKVVNSITIRVKSEVRTFLENQ